MIRDLVSSDPALNEAAWENLRGISGLLPGNEATADSRVPGIGTHLEF